MLDELRAAMEDLVEKRRDADDAVTRARRARADAKSRLVQMLRARERQRVFAASVEQRLDATLAEAGALANIDRKLSVEIIQREAVLVARLRSIAAAAAARAPLTPTGRIPTVTGGGTGFTRVGGIVVASRIASQLQALLAAARSDGLALSGSGYRNPAAQIAVRRANCGTSYYAVYQMPASQCSPPAARPGASMHEQGLAIDFTSGGSLIASRGSPGYRWLSTNAGRFGLRNLPSEPWHWSTNGN